MMSTKKRILNNELIREIIAIRTNTLWKMLFMEERGVLPGIDEEGSTGKFDNKGAIFIPGGLIYQDVDERPITYDGYEKKSARAFRRHVRSAMRYDNATLLFPGGMAASVNLDSGFFSKVARKINLYKKAAFRRKKRVGSAFSLEVSSDDIIRSHCPPCVRQPYGARTRISTCVAIGLVDPAMFFAFCKTEFRFSENQTTRFLQSLDKVQSPVIDDDGTILYTPHVVVCHDTRYIENSYTGLVRILGIGRFGEFCTFTLEKISGKVQRELKRKNLACEPDDIFAEYQGQKIIGILRCYEATNPGKRSNRYRVHIVSPAGDIGINVQQIEKEAYEQYYIM